MGIGLAEPGKGSGGSRRAQHMPGLDLDQQVTTTDITSQSGQPRARPALSQTLFDQRPVGCLTHVHPDPAAAIGLPGARTGKALGRGVEQYLDIGCGLIGLGQHITGVRRGMTDHAGRAGDQNGDAVIGQGQGRGAGKGRAARTIAARIIPGRNLAWVLQGHSGTPSGQDNQPKTGFLTADRRGRAHLGIIQPGLGQGATAPGAEAPVALVIARTMIDSGHVVPASQQLGIAGRSQVIEQLLVKTTGQRIRILLDAISLGQDHGHQVPVPRPPAAIESARFQQRRHLPVLPGQITAQPDQAGTQRRPAPARCRQLESQEVLPRRTTIGPDTETWIGRAAWQ